MCRFNGANADSALCPDPQAYEELLTARGQAAEQWKYNKRLAKEIDLAEAGQTVLRVGESELRLDGDEYVVKPMLKAGNYFLYLELIGGEFDVFCDGELIARHRHQPQYEALMIYAKAFNCGDNPVLKIKLLDADGFTGHYGINQKHTRCGLHAGIKFIAN